MKLPVLHLSRTYHYIHNSFGLGVREGTSSRSALVAVNPATRPLQLSLS